MSRIPGSLMSGTSLATAEGDTAWLPDIAAAGNVAAGAADSGAPVKVGGRVVTGSQTLQTNGTRTDLLTDGYGNLCSRITGNYSVGNDGIANNVVFAFGSSGGTSIGPLITGGVLFNGTTWDKPKKPSAVKRLVSSAATTNADFAKASAGDLFKVTGYNSNAAGRYLKLYNKATAPTVGTDTPVWTEYLPPQARFEVSFGTPLYFSTGIAFALTTGSADSDTGALTAADIVALNLAYA